MNFQWYPGHMTKAKRQMQEDIKLIDLVIELVDARIPLSSRNPDIDELGKNKYRLILMNKADLADRNATEQWSAFFKKKGYYVVSLDARSKNGMKSITDIIMEACKEKWRGTVSAELKTGRSVPWLLEFQMSENPHLSIRMREKRVQRPETSRV